MAKVLLDTFLWSVMGEGHCTVEDVHVWSLEVSQLYVAELAVQKGLEIIRWKLEFGDVLND